MLVTFPLVSALLGVSCQVGLYICGRKPGQDGIITSFGVSLGCSSHRTPLGAEEFEGKYNLGYIVMAGLERSGQPSRLYISTSLTSHGPGMSRVILLWSNRI